MLKAGHNPAFNLLPFVSRLCNLQISMCLLCPLPRMLLGYSCEKFLFFWKGDWGGLYMLFLKILRPLYLPNPHREKTNDEPKKNYRYPERTPNPQKVLFTKIGLYISPSLFISPHLMRFLLLRLYPHQPQCNHLQGRQSHLRTHIHCDIYSQNSNPS